MKEDASKAESKCDSARVEQHYLAQLFFQFELVSGNTCRFNCLLCSCTVTECTAYCHFLFADCGIFFRRKSMCMHIF